MNALDKTDRIRIPKEVCLAWKKKKKKELKGKKKFREIEVSIFHSDSKSNYSGVLVYL